MHDFHAAFDINPRELAGKTRVSISVDAKRFHEPRLPVHFAALRENSMHGGCKMPRDGARCWRL